MIWTASPLCPCVSQVKGFATVEGVSLIEVQGTGMVGVPGTASAIFSAVRDANVNVIMISQASSEHSVSVDICICQESVCVYQRQRRHDLTGVVRAPTPLILPPDPAYPTSLTPDTHSYHPTLPHPFTPSLTPLTHPQICFAVKMADADRAVECVKARFSDAMRAQRISEVTKIDNCTVMAAVGQEMASRKGISAKASVGNWI